MESAPLVILLADDDESDRLVFKEAFRELELKSVVHTVDSGTQLMEYLTSGNAALPDFVFVDVNMPRKNGLTCLKEIRSDEKFKAIPIVIYSTSATRNDVEETFRHGANAYIKKPSDFGTLKQLLAKAVSDARGYREKPLRLEEFLLSV